jgi:hypothetical protein
MKNNLIKSNCLIQSLIVNFKHFPNGRVNFDFNSPSRSISFYCDVKGVGRFRFRRKIMAHGNKSKLLFLGYTYIEKL